MEDESQIFNFDVVKLSTILDRQPVTFPADYVTAVTTLVAMYWVFDVAFPEVSRTLNFLAGHVCKLMPFALTAIMRKVTNQLYK